MTMLLKECSYQVVGMDSNWFGENLFFMVPVRSLMSLMESDKIDTSLFWAGGRQ